MRQNQGDDKGSKKEKPRQRQGFSASSRTCNLDSTPWKALKFILLLNWHCASHGHHLGDWHNRRLQVSAIFVSSIKGA